MLRRFILKTFHLLRSSVGGSLLWEHFGTGVFGRPDNASVFAAVVRGVQIESVSLMLAANHQLQKSIILFEHILWIE